MFTKLALAIGLTAATQAFLVPPSVSSADTDIINALPIADAPQIDAQSLSLKCSGCPVAATDISGKDIWLQGLESELLLSFLISGSDKEVLLLNGVQIFPLQLDLTIETLTAPQITSDGKKDLRLGYELSIKPVAKSEDDELELIAINFQVVEIADKFVNGLEIVKLSLLKTANGKLMIGSLETASTMNPVINPSDSDTECTTLICKWRAIITSKLSGLKPTKGCGSKTSPDQKTHAGGPSRKHHGTHHGHHGHDHKHHGVARIFHTLKRFARHILIPILIGVAVCLTASLIGMLVGILAGNVVVFLWRAIYRRGQRGLYSKVRQEEIFVPGEGDEVKTSLNHEAPPPVYEDVMMNEKTAE